MTTVSGSASSLNSDLRLRTSALLAKAGAAHGFSGRNGGVSAPPFSSLNLSFAVGDDPAAVRENRQRLRKAAGFASLAFVGQEHGSRVLLVDGPVSGHDPQGYDAMITAARGVGLVIQQADCQAVLFYDPDVPAAGIAHCGWRGNVAGVCAEVVAAMERHFGSRPDRIVAAISPSLGPCCAEFSGYRELLPRWMWEFRRGLFFDFPAITRQQLLECGLRPGNIDASHHCNRCDRDFFSHRRGRGLTGRQGSVIGIV